MSNLDLLTPEQAAEDLGCEPEHVNELAAAKKIPAVKFGRSWRFPVEALKAHLVQCAMEHVAEDKPAGGIVPRQPERRQPRRLPDLTQVVKVA